MAIQSHTTSTPSGVSETSEFSGVYIEGVVAGMIGAATIAIWFFIVDLYNGRPFYTPNVLGAALSLSRTITDPATARVNILRDWRIGRETALVGGTRSSLWFRHFAAVRHL
jgi:hypothetical protein